MRSLNPLAAVLVAATLAAAPLRAGDVPEVQFDVAQLISCRDVTTPEFAAANPGEKLLEAAFNISSLVRRGSEQDLAQFFYRLECPQNSLRIVDHLPRTLLASPVVGPIAVEHNDETTQSIGAGVSGQYQHLVKANISGQLGSKQHLAVRYEMLPPQELLAASGTLDRERGVYFKLKPSRQTSLEGARQFVCLFRAPLEWQADYIRIHCSATGIQRGLIKALDEQRPCGSREFLVGLYAEGDPLARQAAAHLVHSHDALRRTLAEHGRRLHRLAHDSPIPGYANLRAWLADSDDPLLPVALELSERESESLPEEVRVALENWEAAEQQVHLLSGGSCGLCPTPAARAAQAD